jgi:hypothetical protein
MGGKQRGKCSRGNSQTGIQKISRRKPALNRRPISFWSSRAQVEVTISSESCLEIVVLRTPHAAKDAVRPHGAFLPVEPRAPLRAPRLQDWPIQNGIKLRLRCPAAACSACGAYELPCLPVDRAGSDWTREKVPEKQDQSALLISFFFKCLRTGRSQYATPVQQRGANTIEGCPKLQLHLLDAATAPRVQKTFGGHCAL